MTGRAAGEGSCACHTAGGIAVVEFHSVAAGRSRLSCLALSEMALRGRRMRAICANRSEETSMPRGLFVMADRYIPRDLPVKAIARPCAF